MQELRAETEHWTIGELPRKRWNVLDLITIIARGTKPAYLFAEVDVTACEGLRARLASQGTIITITAILLKAISIAQIAHPDSRSFRLAWGNQITEIEPVAGFTVERNVGRQPVVFFGVIRAADRKTLKEIGEELEEYGKGSISEVPLLRREFALTRIPWVFRQIGIWMGMRIASLRRSVNPATFGLTSLGKLGVDSLLAPTVSTCIFGVGTVEQRAVAINKTVVEVRKMMTLTLSVDTAVMNIFDAACMLNEIKDLIETGLADRLDPCEGLSEVAVFPQEQVDSNRSAASHCV